MKLLLLCFGVLFIALPVSGSNCYNYFDCGSCTSNISSTNGQYCGWCSYDNTNTYSGSCYAGNSTGALNGLCFNSWYYDSCPNDALGLAIAYIVLIVVASIVFVFIVIPVGIILVAVCFCGVTIAAITGSNRRHHHHHHQMIHESSPIVNSSQQTYPQQQAYPQQPYPQQNYQGGYQGQAYPQQVYAAQSPIEQQPMAGYQQGPIDNDYVKVV
eukprot:TRINITY_DN8000_c0_g2_i1.p1 TRINITY_DN8000_c0_g2~~TRINITY_DN8000_c0_g2_i1.p1  ORF type:complete len:213 (+),score=11.34 TRINITY_DN8000_c0_g2_i1:119-757(+)